MKKTKNKHNVSFPFIFAFFGIFLIFVILAFKGGDDSQSRTRDTSLPEGYNDLFAGSGECLLCHNSMVNSSGESIGVLDDWRSTMLANAAKDPFWQAKVSHEGLVNPEHKAVLEDVCTKCHMPAGQINAHHNGQALYSLAEGQSDLLAMDGIQCTVCHQITAESLGNFSANVTIGTDSKIWGQYEAPFANPMVNNTGYTPEYSSHIKDARLCGSCHSLITNSVDLNGVPTGEEFVEQAIYQEWDNSIFSTDQVTCQDCHVPEIDDLVKISAFPWWLDERSPFGQHQFAGANVFMTKLLKSFGEDIGVTATDSQFDSTYNRSARMLRHRTLDLSIVETNRTPDTLFAVLTLKNKAGHKFPAGYPSRRAFVELVTLSENGDTLFHSGEMDEDFNLINESVTYENHHQIINNEEQVQIYEMVMGDVNNDVTTVLERAFVQLKDNRLPPQGFKKSHSSYDTAQIVGLALDDINFNRTPFSEGTGLDMLSFHIPTMGYAGEIRIVARIYYQTVTNKWLEHMFSYSSDEIDAFKTYYQSSDLSPFEVASVNLLSGPRVYAQLNEGWNSLSSYIMPANTDMEDVLASIFNSIEIVSGQDGIFYPSGGIYTLSDFDPYQGYSIKMNNAELLEIKGEYLSESTLAMTGGWSILPSISPCDIAISDLSGGFLNKLEVIVELSGYRVYWPEKEVFSLQMLRPGKAYLIKLSEAGEVIFPDCI